MYCICVLLLLYCIINPRRACTARVTVVVLSFCLSVCLSVCYHVFCRYAQQDGQYAILMGSVPHWLYFKNSVFVKMLCSRVMAWNKVKKLICKLALAYLDQLCVPWRHQKLQRRASIDSRVLSSSVASPWLTLSKLVHGKRPRVVKWTSPPITVPRMWYIPHMRTYVSHAYS